MSRAPLDQRQIAVWGEGESTGRDDARAGIVLPKRYIAITCTALTGRIPVSRNIHLAMARIPVYSRRDFCRTLHGGHGAGLPGLNARFMVHAGTGTDDSPGE